MIVMKPFLNPCTLEYENVKIPQKYLKWDIQFAEASKKVIILIQVLLSVCNFSFAATIPMTESQDRGEIVACTLLGDLVPLASMLIFYILLPKLSITFTGSALIPMVILITCEFEFNARIYPDFANVAN